MESKNTYTTTKNILESQDSDNGRLFKGERQSCASSDQNEVKGQILKYRTASKAYWAGFLAITAIYLSQLNHAHSANNINILGKSLSILYIMAFNTLLIISANILETNLPKLFGKLVKFNVIMTIISCIYCLQFEGSLYGVLSLVALNFAYPYIFLNIILHNPKSFTFGEAALTTSAFCYFFWDCSQRLPYPKSPLSSSSEHILLGTFIQVVFFCLLLGCRFLLLFSKPSKLLFLQEFLCLWSKSCLLGFVYRLSHPTDDLIFLVQWILHFLFNNIGRILVLSTWAGLVCLAVFVVWQKNQGKSNSTTSERKIFHFMIAAVYLIGILFEYNLLYFSSAIVFFVFIFLEVTRALRLNLFGLNLGSKLNDSIQVFKDNQDEGMLVLTPIYLLVGCSLPIWLTGLQYSQNKIPSVDIISSVTGILSVGIGDTFASIGGSLYGRTKWAGSRKTIEGTVSSFISQVLTVLLLCVAGGLEIQNISFTSLLFSILVNSLVEAKTDQIDNLIIPLVTYNVFHLSRTVLSFLAGP